MTAAECRGCPFPDSVAALELVRLREGIGRLASEWERGANALEGTPMAWDLRRYARAVRALLDDNQGDSC